MERLEQANKFSLQQKTHGNSSNNSSKRKRRNDTDSEEEPAKKKCRYCKKMVFHKSSDCWMKPGNENKKRKWSWL